MVQANYKKYMNYTAAFLGIFAMIMLGIIFVVQEANSIDRLRYQQMSALERLKFNNSNAVETNEKLQNNLRILLPNGLTENDVTVENDYVHRTVKVEVPRFSEQMLAKNPIIGSSNNINNMSVEIFDNTLYVEIQTDGVLESSVNFEDQFLYIGLKSPRDLYDKIIVLDAGHGGSDPGSIKGSIQECDIDLKIVNYLKDYLEDEGIRVYLTRTEDENVYLDSRVSMANSLEADAFISIHNNWAKGNLTYLNGTQVLYNETDDTEKSLKLAKLCLDTVTEQCESKRLSCTPGSDIYIIRSSEVPVSLIEVGFMSNEEELEKLTSEEYQKKAARAVADALLEAYKKGII